MTTDPGYDRVGTIRIQPGDNPAANNALRVIAVAGRSPHHVRLTGGDWEAKRNGGQWWTDEAIAEWPVQSWHDFAAAVALPEEADQ